MPSLKQLKKVMQKQKISPEIMAQMDLDANQSSSNPYPLIAAIDKMDELLTKEQRLSIMEQLGCCKTDKVTAPFKEFGRKYADKTIDDKIKLFDELNTPHRPPCHLNPDGTLSVYWDGQCVCSVIQKLPPPVCVSSTYCGCCGGHVRHTLQHALGVKLRLKDIVSTAISSHGKNHCEFVFEVIDLS
ncbi:MAG: hypothetical protein FWF05_01770 [Oscillospiraceae bacterium]|nr:hypothetical protein [Oscillospiraceae bacterium]